MIKIQNIAAYKFASLSDLKGIRLRLLALCKEHGLKGTILLSTEGINLFVAGPGNSVQVLLVELRAMTGLESLEVKISESDHQPFNRMLVRIKKEIIAFGVPGIDPSRGPAPKISAQTLKQWLDEGKPLTLLDTRNEYEVRLGTFENARALGIDHFRNFPEAVRQLPAELKEEPIVMFCTGGIRCEKAGPFMEQQGYKNIFQLEGGILKYFEECGGAHYKGECFVFDQRVGLDPSLHETDSTQCFYCLTPLTKEEQEDERYVAGKSCPYCFKTSEQAMRESISRREEAIRALVNPLPGSVSYDNFRPLSVPQECDGMTVMSFLTTILAHISSEQWHDVISQGLLLDLARRPVKASHLVRPGERYLHKLPSTVEPDVNADVRILHEDEALVVLNKPAPLPMHPGGRYNRNTVHYILGQVYYPQKPRPAHRLDANTTGLVLVTRTRHFASKLQPQFASGEVKKSYLVRVNGKPERDSFISEAPISVEPGEIGSRVVDHDKGLSARTEFHVLSRYADGTTLLEARPITGRTNQIRIHLWQLGHPVCGDSTYLADEKIGDTQTLGVQEKPLCLHAWKIAFKHPLSRKPLEFTAPAPDWARFSE
jgi:UPF0176 protein